ncbi:MAG: hypothetical protein KAS66_08140 [Candidatus Omnitrophica bacterium]|nr:hypothetical protein [Candidatus Omnitrophota bacterium]
MKNTILKQTESSWPPLSPITLRMKAPERRKLYESGALVGDIKSRIHNTYATIGIHPDAPNHDKGMYNEYGTQHIPARSFVRSTWSKYHKTVIDMVTVTFVKRIKKIGR